VQFHRNNHVDPLGPAGQRFVSKKKKAHSLRVGRSFLISLCLDDGPSLPVVGPVRKSPPIRIGCELHAGQFTGFRAKRKPEIIYARH
jgi:hypothetical protein